MRQLQHSVYVITFSNGKQYVGVTSNVDKRLTEHKSANRPVGRAMRKHSYACEVVFTGSREDCFAKEIELIAELDTISPAGYNLTPGGDGVPLTDDVRAKLSQAAQRQWNSPEGRLRQVEAAQRRFADSEEREAHRKRCNDPEERRRRSERAKAQWAARRAA